MTIGELIRSAFALAYARLVRATPPATTANCAVCRRTDGDLFAVDKTRDSRVVKAFWIRADDRFCARCLTLMRTTFGGER